MRKITGALFVGALIAAVSTPVVAAPAAATTASVLACTNNGPYSFKTEVATTYSTIRTYRGSGCSGGQISYGRVTLVASDVVVYAIDIACDNIGLTTTTSGGFSVPSGGCGTTRSHRGSRSLAGNYFWVVVQARYQSPTHPIPI